MNLEMDKPRIRVCSDCLDMRCYERTGMAGRIVRFIPGDTKVYDWKENIDQCLRKQAYKKHV